MLRLVSAIEMEISEGPGSRQKIYGYERGNGERRRIAAAAMNDYLAEKKKSRGSAHG